MFCFRFETGTGIEPVHRGFANHCVTASPPGLIWMCSTVAFLSELDKTNLGASYRTQVCLLFSCRLLAAGVKEAFNHFFG